VWVLGGWTERDLRHNSRSNKKQKGTRDPPNNVQQLPGPPCERGEGAGKNENGGTLKMNSECLKERDGETKKTNCRKDGTRATTVIGKGFETEESFRNSHAGAAQKSEKWKRGEPLKGRKRFYKSAS